MQPHPLLGKQHDCALPWSQWASCWFWLQTGGLLCLKRNRADSDMDVMNVWQKECVMCSMPALCFVDIPESRSVDKLSSSSSCLLRNGFYLSAEGDGIHAVDLSCGHVSCNQFNIYICAQSMYLLWRLLGAAWLNRLLQRCYIYQDITVLLTHY